MRILFVDDEQRVLDGLRRSLGALEPSWSLMFVSSATAAMELLTSHTFDVLVTDLDMPGENGVSLLQHVASRTPQMGRIVLSGHCRSELAEEARNFAHAMLAKPADLAVITSTLREVYVSGAGNRPA